MKGDRLPIHDHIGIHCTPKAFLEKDVYGRPVGVNADAFRADPDGISCDWLEYEGSTFDERFARLCSRTKLLRTVKASHRIAMMKVEDVESVKNGATFLHVEHDPIVSPPNPAHSLIKGIGPDDTEALQELTLLVQLHNFTA